MNFNQLMKQAQQMQRKVNKVKKELDNEIYDFESQQGAVQGKIHGKLEIAELNINDQMLNNENKEILQDLIMVSLNETIKKINKEREDALNKVTNGVDVSAFL